ncbi:alpha/beta fold hydrolase [Flavobacterium sp. HSC-61S13]|uniref:alpha/beta fold hydrolase n=1 Tax=Flavobacterium sp. HSC-61S13 TaxID=2910963 RepID=UPI0020A1DFEA|nr:alpha/beta fold hydrolase [Flavobacterium sp. HSC-61S13]MCP1996485.1 pimeloyl-ACP methyl ester carboxylesterase [Flavobacterium sp. HSC-61S13]
MKNILLGVLLIFCSMISSCKGLEQKNVAQIDEDFFIPVEKSMLYTRVVGNSERPIIISLHGGPGAFSVDHEFYRDVFEKEYLVVYFDQRGGGKSDEFRDKSMFTTDQFVKDLDRVVDFIREKYPNKKINLLGTSWGGTYGFLYMIKHQEKINSFISSSGFVDSPQRNFALIAHERKLAQALLKTETDSIKITRYQQILKKLEQIETSGFKDFFNDMNVIRYEFPKDLGFDVYWAKPEMKEVKNKLLNDPDFYVRVKYSPEQLETALERMEYINAIFMNTESYNNLNIVNEIGVIKKPVLVLQGEDDYAIGVEQGRTIYKALKAIPSKDKELLYIHNASHNTPFEAPEIYYNAMRAFFKKHN